MISFKNFEEAGKQALDLLHKRLDFKLWMITRIEGDEAIVLQADSNTYNIKPGHVFYWDDSYCRHMTEGKAPNIAPIVADIPLYASANLNKLIDIKSYIGYPLLNEDGSVFGTICAIDPEPKSEEIKKEADLIETICSMLCYLLQGELRENVQNRLLERLEVEALTDSLTGLYNRRAWDKLVASEEERCKCYGLPASVFIIDLNNIKEINDSLGHFSGDDLIKKTAIILKECTRDKDVVARLGGDEFGILSVENSYIGCEKLSERILDAFREKRINTAVGYAIRHPSYDLYHTIIQADKNMYLHKRQLKENIKSHPIS